MPRIDDDDADPYLTMEQTEVLVEDLVAGGWPDWAKLHCPACGRGRIEVKRNGAPLHADYLDVIGCTYCGRRPRVEITYRVGVV